jgi:protein-L-isoaspartate(D-aspartate) O-methyltransferase
MIDFERARRTMVESQIRPVDVTDTRVLDAFLKVPRETFLPESKRALAYLDMDLALTSGRPPRSLLQPMVLARLLQAVEIGPTDRVLDVGAATGYSSAVLAHLCAEVVALECDEPLAEVARRTLGDVANAGVVTGPLESGHAPGAPYDVIVLEGAVETVPSTLLDQLGEEGRLVAVIGFGRSGRASLFVKVADDVSRRIVFDILAPPLPGFVKPPAFSF